MQVDALHVAASRDPTLVCLNVKFSPNLGDGLLSECLEQALVGHGAHADTTSVDLAGRTAYGQTMAGRGAVMKVLDALPPGLRNLAVRAPLAVQSRRKWAPHYSTGITGADAIAIGGGNLLSDQDLNFPTKLALALRTCGHCHLPVAFFACGMGGTWTGEGVRRMQGALRACPVRAVFLRDEMSKDRWDNRFAEVSGQEAVVVRDPGLLALDTYGRVRKAAGQEPVIGVGIMSHVAVRYHAEARQSSADLMKWYVDLVGALAAKGAQIVVFTNGASEDNTTLHALQPELAAFGDRVRLVVPDTPRELSDIVGALNGLVAYRMHALISAYSHGVPSLALRWDDKIDAFLASIGRSDWLDDPTDLLAEAAADRVLEAAEQGVDTAVHAQVTQEARQDVGRLFQALSSA
ncbi:MAG: polysaccharide pyruvyl transferase family protein [Pseudomonadota bacterium]